jgi:hypothetical protein
MIESEREFETKRACHPPLLFHEGLHGYTGASDSSLLDDFGFNGINDPSCKITDYLELKIWAGTITTCGH